MASFREHIGFSSLLGVGYGLGAMTLLEFTPTQSALAGAFAGVGGMLPDLDSPTGKPGQEIFGITAALAPLVLIGHVLKWSGLPAETESVMLLLLGMYFAIRYGGAWLVNQVSVHRGMFHSIPALVIAAEMTYLGYPSDLTTVKLLMGGGVALGFFSHLLLDEIYAVDWSGPLPRVKKSFGTAIKFTGKGLAPTAMTYGILATLTYIMFQDAGLIPVPQDHLVLPIGDELPQEGVVPEFETPPLPGSPQEAVLPPELTDAPLFR